jgi:hypothetical protein
MCQPVEKTAKMQISEFKVTLMRTLQSQTACELYRHCTSQCRATSWKLGEELTGGMTISPKYWCEVPPEPQQVYEKWPVNLYPGKIPGLQLGELAGGLVLDGLLTPHGNYTTSPLGHMPH